MDKNTALDLLGRTYRLYGVLHRNKEIMVEAGLHLDNKTKKIIGESTNPFTLIKGNCIDAAYAAIYAHFAKGCILQTKYDKGPAYKLEKRNHYKWEALRKPTNDETVETLSVNNQFIYKQVSGMDMQQLYELKMEETEGIDYGIIKYLELCSTVFLMDFWKGITDKENKIALEKFSAELYRLKVKKTPPGFLIISTEDVESLPENFVKLFDVVKLQNLKQKKKNVEGLTPGKKEHPLKSEVIKIIGDVLSDNKDLGNKLAQYLLMVKAKMREDKSNRFLEERKKSGFIFETLSLKDLIREHPQYNLNRERVKNKKNVG